MIKKLIACLCLTFSLVAMTEKAHAVSDMDEQLKMFAAVFGRAGACEIPIDEEVMRVFMWIEMMYREQAPNVVEEIFFPEAERNATLQKSNSTGETCEEVKQIYQTIRWP